MGFLLQGVRDDGGDFGAGNVGVPDVRFEGLAVPERDTGDERLGAAVVEHAERKWPTEGGDVDGG